MMLLTCSSFSCAKIAARKDSILYQVLLQEERVYLASSIAARTLSCSAERGEERVQSRASSSSSTYLSIGNLWP